jgi:hypothetical protein
VTDSSAPTKKSRRHIPILLFLTAGLPVILASIMYFTGSLVPEARNNRGALILPTLLVEKLELQLQKKADGDVKGKWQLIVFGQDDCGSKQCQEMLHNTRQVNIALGREAGRVVRRYVNIGGAMMATTVEALKTSYPRLHLSHTSSLALAVFLDKELDAGEVTKGSYVFITDPLGNVMMFYTLENPGGDILYDLKKLLKVSNIG